ncbi:hypothetical protein OUZ56_020095 [Daphnia magna]|uniref:Uncharacterized protein n=1 Tax=Daphnia magna TaxID=35525 RepID=A0ABQ9ZF06_9CRUS|nr:hypothetical protein OUZ56_020095 [Daphnia magna]
MLNPWGYHKDMILAQFCSGIHLLEAKLPCSGFNKEEKEQVYEALVFKTQQSSLYMLVLSWLRQKYFKFNAKNQKFLTKKTLSF